VGDEGLEPHRLTSLPPNDLGNQAGESGAESGAVSCRNSATGGEDAAADLPGTDPRKARLLALYDSFDEARQNKLLALAETLAKVEALE
jgi:hypothetical protein